MIQQQIETCNPDGSTNQISIFRNTGNELAPIILILPAMGVWAKFYQPLAEAFAAANMIAATVDLRGNGTSSIRPNKNIDFGYREMIDLDYETVLSSLKKQFPKNKIYFLGHSLGGQLACLYLSKKPKAVDGLILIACCSVYYKGWAGIMGWGTLVMTQTFRLIATLMGYFPGKKVGFGGLEAKTVIKDWSRQGRTGKYILANDDFDYETALQSLVLPTFVLTFEADTFAPAQAAKNLYQKMKSPEKIKHLHLRNNDPRNERFNHFNWVKKPKNIIAILQENLIKS